MAVASWTRGARGVTRDVEKGGVSRVSVGPSRAMICKWLGHFVIAYESVSQRVIHTPLRRVEDVTLVSGFSWVCHSPPQTEP